MITDNERIGGFFRRLQRIIIPALGPGGLCVAILVAGGPQTSTAQENLQARIRDAELQLGEGRSTLNEDTLIAARRTFESCTHQNANHSRCYYDLGLTDTYLFEVRERPKDKRAMQHALNSAIDNTQHSIVLNDGSADSHALLADLYGRKIGYGGMLAGMRYGPKAEAESRRALQLDPNNPRIYVAQGRRQLYAPRMFGGDLEKAIESFRKSTTVDPHYDEGFVWLAIAYGKKRDSEASKAALDEALRINSQNIVAKEMRSTMK